jgi:hypothetical protein
MFFLGLVLIPGPLIAMPSGASVAVAWDASSDTTVTGYNVYYGGASRNYTNVISAGNSTSAIISNLVSGATYYFAATTYTAAGLESDYSAEAAYTVPQLNVPPTLDPVANVTIVQDSAEQTIRLTGISPGSSNETQSLSVSAFSSNLGLVPNPVVSYSSPDDTGSLTFSPAPGSFGSAIITVMVDDGGLVSNTVIRSFVVTVSPINNPPPTIDPVNNLVINENSGVQTLNLTGITAGSTNSTQALSVKATSSNPNLIPDPVVSYSSPSSSASLQFSPAANGLGVATITVTVSDSQSTNNSTSISFNVAVNQVVLAPGTVASVMVSPNTTLRLQINPPVNNGDKLNMNLTGNVPVGAKLTARKGVFWLVWTPVAGQASTTNLIGIKITDLTNPSLSTNETVQVIVQDYLALTLGSTSVQAGQGGSIPISVSSSDGITNLSFTMAWPTNLLTNPTLYLAAPGIASSSLKNQNSNLLFTVQMLPGQMLQGSNVVGTVTFQALSGQPSGYINIPANNLSAFKPSSGSYSASMATAGQVAIVNAQAMLQATATADPTRSLTILGKLGANYQVQYCTNFGPGAVWYPLGTFNQTNTSQIITVNPTIPSIFYRVQQK